MQIDVGNRRLEKLGYLRLRQPQRFILEPALNAGTPILGLIEQEFGLGQRLSRHAIISR
jgi:hypothetical protein